MLFRVYSGYFYHSYSQKTCVPEGLQILETILGVLDQSVPRLTESPTVKGEKNAYKFRLQTLRGFERILPSIQLCVPIYEVAVIAHLGLAVVS